ncbi:hypothetical protein BDP55DRAFT_396984 [Colletotrichum godetiae]|uniref:N-acetyltransferase domain-containing protein n=1 Tax=Colletotrichum godetiae TaxID=1209918 RepID=A0AAJ0ENC6_9PEZI|nr:uncharacterized protein BDP55DRAFT_396984 [Colletotrichum godetiae]KAK1658441.1 hypothetical protein BDP55DRAFT_396984 [Colletotrichum godetiae]
MQPSTPLILPKSHPDPAKFQTLLNRYKSFRLSSLLLSPSCFGSTHAREVVYPPEKWISRLTDPLATTIVIYKDASPAGIPTSVDSATSTASSPFLTDKNSLLDNALTAEWLATLTINGPLDPQTLTTSLHLDPTLVDFGPTHQTSPDAPLKQYVINGMFVIPTARGKHLGTKLLEYAKAHVAAKVRAQGQKKGGARISLIVDYDNEPARKTYERSEFEVVHRYWFKDYRVGRESRTEAAVMVLDL